LCLDGNRTIRITPGVFSTFRKLKILATSQQQRTHFRLKFQLKRYVGNVFETIEGVSVISNPIEVFSHSYYLSGSKNKVIPPRITEVLPAFGPACGGTRLAILGSNFINTSNLKVKFGETLFSPEFHEAGTLIITAPTGVRGMRVPITVSNDGTDFCQSDVIFTYI